MAGYALELSDGEIRRYQRMASAARRAEADLWTSAGIGPGANVADVGCGPGAVAVELGRAVGPRGKVTGVDQDPETLNAAAELVREAGLDNVELRRGLATESGLPRGEFDVAMLRHVLSHNGGQEQAIVAHLAGLVKPGGLVYLVDIDATAFRTLGQDSGLDDLAGRYADFQRRRGNDLSVGLKLGRLIRGAGLELSRYQGVYQILDAPPGLRPPAWAARRAMVEAGLAAESDITRWRDAFLRMDALAERPTFFVAQFVGVGRSAGPAGAPG